MISRLKGGVFFSLFSVFGNLASTGFSALALIILSRWLGPAQFGLFSVLFALGAMTSKIADFGLNAAMVKYAGQTENLTQIQRVFSEVLRLKALISVLVLVVAALTHVTLAHFLRIDQPGLVFLALTASLSIYWYEQLVYMMQSLHLFVKSVLVNTFQAVTKFLGVIMLLTGNWISLPAALLLFWVAPAVPVIFSAWFIPQKIRIHLPQFHPPTQGLILSFARHTAWTAITAAVIENVDVLFVQRFLSDYETGLFAGAWRIATLIILAGYSLGTVLNPRVSRYSSFSDMRSYIWKASALIGLLLGGFVLTVPLLPLIVSLTIGPEYLASVPVLVPLIAAAFLSVATVPLVALFYQFEAAWYFSVTAIIQLSIIVVGNWFWVPTGGLMAAGLTRLIAQLTAFALTIGVATYYFNQSKRATRVKPLRR